MSKVYPAAVKTSRTCFRMDGSVNDKDLNKPQKQTAICIFIAVRWFTHWAKSHRQQLPGINGSDCHSDSLSYNSWKAWHSHMWKRCQSEVIGHRCYWNQLSRCLAWVTYHLICHVSLQHFTLHTSQSRLTANVMRQHPTNTVNSSVRFSVLPEKRRNVQIFHFFFEPAPPKNKK